jgi:hypothetical protein
VKVIDVFTALFMFFILILLGAAAQDNRGH